MLDIKISDVAQCLVIAQGVTVGKSGWGDVEGKILEREDCYEWESRVLNR